MKMLYMVTLFDDKNLALLNKNQPKYLQAFSMEIKHESQKYELFSKPNKLFAFNFCKSI